MKIKSIEQTANISRNLSVAQFVQYNLLAYMHFILK